MARDYSGRIFAGLLIIGIGLIFLLGSFNQIEVGEFFADYWPLFLIFIGIWHLVSHDFRFPVGGFILIVIGIFFQLRNLDILDWNVWQIIWPSLIILVGMWIIFYPQRLFRRRSAAADRQNDLEIFTILSGVERFVESKEFHGGNVTALLGSVKIDLNQAELAGREAVIEMTAILSSIEVRVPHSWKLIIDSRPVLGSVEDKHRMEAAEARAPKVLHLRATPVLGSIEIKN